MADTKISQLTAVPAASGTDEFAVNQGGVSKKETLSQMKDFLHIGPLRVVNASNPNEYIEIDPDNARILAASGARPTRKVALPAVRNYGPITQTTIGNVMTAVYVTPTTLGGMYIKPMLALLDMDLTMPSKVYLIIAPTVNATTNGQVVTFQLSEVHVSNGQGRTENSFSYNWSVPDNWTTDQTNIVMLDNGSGYSFPGSRFSSGQALAFRFARQGSNAADTFDKNVAMAESVIFEYTALEF